MSSVNPTAHATPKETFKPGETVTYAGEYCVVNSDGKELEYEYVTLEEGDKFPELKSSQGHREACGYRLQEDITEEEDGTEGASDSPDEALEED